MARFKIEVTDKDIENSKTDDYCICPVGIAIKRVAPLKGMLMGIVDVHIHEAGKCLSTFPLPNSAIDFIKNHDEGKFCSPFSFFLEIPDNVLAAYHI